MSARSTGSATIAFGLVSVPVKYYTAVEPQSGVSFNLLHGKCGSRLKQQYVCPADGEVVPREAMVKGYEHAKGQYATFAPEELKALEEHASGTLEIGAFVLADAVDPIYLDKSYYVSPDKGGAKAFALLREAMVRSGRVAVGKYAARGKQYLALIRPSERGMVMQHLHFGEEIRDEGDVPQDRVAVREDEVTLAMRLVESFSKETHDPSLYRDEVQERLREAVDRKIAGKGFALPEVKAAPAGGDIMAALQASLKKRGE